MNDFEINILNFIQDSFACPFLDKVMPIITLFGDKGIFWIAVALILIIIKKTRKTGVMMGTAFGAYNRECNTEKRHCTDKTL